MLEDADQRPNPELANRKRECVHAIHLEPLHQCEHAVVGAEIVWSTLGGELVGMNLVGGR